MYVSRQIALEIFGLRENFTEEEVTKNYRRLSKIVHPDMGGDENLFKFIMCCKETLYDNLNANNEKQTHEETKHREAPKDYSKESVDVDLRTLYDIYHVLDRYLHEYDIIDVKGSAKISVIPCKNKKYCESIIFKVTQPFREFRELDFVNFSARVKLPEKFKKFKKFKIVVEFMGETFKFKLKMNRPFYTVKYKKNSFNSISFSSIIELTFE